MTGRLLFSIGVAVAALAFGLRDLRPPQRYEFAQARARLLLLIGAASGVYAVIQVVQILNS